MSLQAKFCSTVANDIMLDTSVGVVRMWADETSRLSRFRMLFTSFADREFLPDVVPRFTLSLRLEGNSDLLWLSANTAGPMKTHATLLDIKMLQNIIDSS